MKKNLLFLIVLIVCVISNKTNAQQCFPDMYPVYTDTDVPRIDITIAPADLEQIYLYENLESDVEYPAQFIYTSNQICDTFEVVGFRLRGNTSRYSAKKSFKVSFNTYVAGKEFYGLDKLNLNGEHNDPSIIRSKLCSDILYDFAIPASRANHVALYINGDYYGLYISVEHIDDNFLDKRFERSNGNLYKCYYSANLQYISSNPDDYKFTNGDGDRVYELKNNEELDDYSDLAEFIDVLNNTSVDEFPSNLEPLFNVNLYLKTLAFDVLTSNWDGYAYNQNNYYLYHNPTTGRFIYLPYDLDNTFGIDWFGIDWTTRNIYDWAENNRPLANRLLQNEEYKKRFSFYLNELIDNVMNTTAFYPTIDNLKAMITSFAIADTYRTMDYGFTVQNFEDSYTSAIGMHVKAGLKPFINDRNLSAKSQLDLQSVSPLVSIVEAGFLKNNQPFKTEIYAEDDGTITSVVFNYRLDQGDWQTLTMADDGLNADTMANDQVYTSLTGVLTDVSRIDFYYELADNDANNSREPYSGFYTITRPNESDLNIVINEFMADNDNIVADEDGEYEDWIELYNAGTEQVFLGDIYLTDDFLNPNMWRLPDEYLAPNEFILIWADNDTEQSKYHANFKLSKDGEEIGVYLKNGNEYLLVDSLTFGAQETDISYGCVTDGSIEYKYFGDPTPGYSNSLSKTEQLMSEITLNVYPNPVVNTLYLAAEGVYVKSYTIYEINGRKLLSDSFFESSNNQLFADYNNVNEIDVSSLSEGIYFISAIITDGNIERFITKKIVKK